MNNDRLILHTVHTDEGATELYFGRTNDDHPGPSDLNTVQFGKDGSLIFKAHTNEEVGYVVTICANRTVVLLSPDMLSMEEIDNDAWNAQECIVFDSTDLKYEEK